MQKNSMLLSLLLGCTTFVALNSTVQAAETKVTTITIDGSMCNCVVKRITDKLKPITDVADVTCDKNAKTVTVTPQKGKTLSPRKLWDAMEEIGKTPTKLAGPSGTFTKKPKA